MSLRRLASPVLLAALAVTVVLLVVATELTTAVIRSAPSPSAAGTLLFFVGIVGIVANGVVLFAATATRVPYAALGLSLAAFVLQSVYLVVRFGADPVGAGLLWGLLAAATAVVLDLVLLRHAGRAVPVGAVIAGALGVALLRLLVEAVRNVALVDSVVVLRSVTFWVDGLVVAPGVLVAAAVLGWSIGLRRPSPPVPAAG